MIKVSLTLVILSLAIAFWGERVFKKHHDTIAVTLVITGLLLLVWYGGIIK